jgi:hypothetical protein
VLWHIPTIFALSLMTCFFYFRFLASLFGDCMISLIFYCFLKSTVVIMSIFLYAICCAAGLWSVVAFLLANWQILYSLLQLKNVILAVERPRSAQRYSTRHLHVYITACGQDVSFPPTLSDSSEGRGRPIRSPKEP